MQAVILAGGKGTRMQKVYPNIPKLLTPILDKPFLDHLIDYLKQFNCRNVIICTGFQGDKIRDYVRKKNYGIAIRLSEERKELGTGGALNQIKEFFEQNFFLLFGDVFMQVNMKNIIASHKKNKALITAVTHKSKHPEDSNLVQFNSDGRIIRILKKPHSRIPKNPYNLAAMYLINKKIKRYLFSKTPYDFEQDLLTKLIDENIPVHGYNTKEFITDFGTQERLETLEKELQK